MMAITSPPIQYTGSKWKVAQFLLRYFPKHECYVEAFCGGASVLFRKSPSPIEVINDLDGSVINFFDVLRTRPKELMRAIKLTPYSRAEVIRAHVVTGDPLEDARRFYVRARQQFGGVKVDSPNSWRYRTRTKTKQNPLGEWLDPNRFSLLMETAKRLRQVYIENDSALKVIARFDTPETLFYLDPPYLAETRTDIDYVHEMTEIDHIALSDALHNIKGMAVLSGYDSPLYQRLYADWHSASVGSHTIGSVKSREFIWMNPAAQARQLQARLI